MTQVEPSWGGFAPRRGTLWSSPPGIELFVCFRGGEVKKKKGGEVWLVAFGGDCAGQKEGSGCEMLQGDFFIFGSWFQGNCGVQLPRS